MGVFYIMWDTTLYTLRALAVASGSLLIYLAIFLYEDQQKNLQNKLEDLWLQIDDRHHIAVSKHTAFMRVVADFTSKVFDKIFGNKLFSFQSIGVSACFSLASYAAIKIWRNYPFLHLSNLVNLTILIVFLCLGVFPSLVKRTKLKLAWFASVISSLIIGIFLVHFRILDLHKFTVPDLTQEMLFDLQVGLFPLYAGILIGSLCDMIFIVVVRFSLRLSSDLRSFFKISLIGLSNCVFALVMFVIPYYYLHSITIRIESYILPKYGYQRRGYILAFQFDNLFSAVIYSNLLTALAASVFVVLIIFMLIHRLFWPFLSRPLYSLQRFEIARRNKVLGAIGVTLIGIGVGYIPAWLKDVVEKINP